MMIENGFLQNNTSTSLYGLHRERFRFRYISYSHVYDSSKWSRLFQLSVCLFVCLRYVLYGNNGLRVI